MLTGLWAIKMLLISILLGIVLLIFYFTVNGWGRVDLGVSRPCTLQKMARLFVADVGSIMGRILSGKQWEHLKSFFFFPEQDCLHAIREIRLLAKKLATLCQDSMNFAEFAHGRVKSVKLWVYKSPRAALGFVSQSTTQELNNGARESGDPPAVATASVWCCFSNM